MARDRDLIDALEAEIQSAHRALDRAGAPDGPSLTRRILALAERLKLHAAPVTRGGPHEHDSTLDEML